MSAGRGAVADVRTAPAAFERGFRLSSKSVVGWIAALLLGASRLFAQAEIPGVVPAPAEMPAASDLASVSATPEDAPAPASPSVPKIVGNALWNEAKRYGSDTAALVVAPFHWDASDGWRAAGAAALIGGAFAADREVYDAFARNRSDFTDAVSKSTTWFGGGGAIYVALGLVGTGLAVGSPDVRDMGRDALEAAIIAGVFTNWVIKPTAGRWRPRESNGDTIFDPFSGHDSFTSGHATQAFAVASVIAMRSPGWILPSVAYGLAFVVACDRINDRAHFASDVVAGALFATATGRFLVRRHGAESALEIAPEPKTSFEVVPIPDGVALRARW
jgi:membrane-associated phospholipid phosphatase